MARMAAAQADWHADEKEGDKRTDEGAVTIMGKDGNPVEPREVFVRVRARLRAGVGEDVFNSWFARLELEEVVDDLAHLSVPTKFLMSWIQSNYAERILEAFRAETAGVARLHFTVRVNGQSRPLSMRPAEPVRELEPRPWRPSPARCARRAPRPGPTRSWARPSIPR